MQEFDAYLESKKIDPAGFRKGQPDRYSAFASLYAQVSPASFTQQKLFLINGLRRQYPLEVPSEEEVAATTTKSTKSGVRIPKPSPKKPS